MTNLFNLDDKMPHKTNSVICLSCLHDWQAVYPENTDINNLECPNCKEQNSIEFNLITARKIIKFLSEQGNIKADSYVNLTYELKNPSIFKKITEATLLIEKHITENNRYGYGIVTSLLDGVEKIFPDIPKRNENIITMRICDNLERRGISFSF